MLAKFLAQTSLIRPSHELPAFKLHKKKFIFKITCCEQNASSPDSESPTSSSIANKFGFKLLGRSLGDKNWKLNDIDTNAMHESVNQWLSWTQSFLNDMTSPIVKPINDRRLNLQIESEDTEDILITEWTIDSRTPGGELSEAAIISIEQFSRMNGLTGKKMQKIFKALVPEFLYNDSRNLIEYCCFRFLSRNSADVHPGLKESAFRRLIFITMLAWEYPNRKGNDSQSGYLEKDTFQRKLVGEDAFVRIAPAVSGVADYPTAQNLFAALAGDAEGISYGIWSAYITELLKVHEGRKSNEFQEFSRTSMETILCLGSSRKQPVIKWEKNMAWPGKLTLTDRALYFEAVGLVGERDTVRLDLTHNDSKIEKTRVGPLGSNLFDSALSITTSGPEFEPLVLEFVDLTGEMRRDVWFAFINEVISFHKFLSEYGPKEDDQSVFDVYGSHRGNGKAKAHAINAITRLQSLQFMRRTLDEPTKLVPFSYLENAPFGDIVLQTLAVNFWGGPIIRKLSVGDKDIQPHMVATGASPESSNHIFDIDGGVYLRKWMTSASWGSNASQAFWKNMSMRQGVVLSKNLVVADKSIVERAATTCMDKSRVAEKTQATIDAAMIEGIPSNIDLFKELVFPLTITARNFERLRRWDDPVVTASFLGLVYTLIFKNLLWYVLPASLMILACGMLLLKGLKEQGRLGRFFGKVTIFDQPPSNTIQKIIALKEAMRELEKYLQNVNVVLLKIRSVILAGHPQVTMEVAVVLLLGSMVLVLIPFNYIFAFLLFDLFTRELKFRRKMVIAFMSLLKERWDMVPVAPVVVLPLQNKNSGDEPKKPVDNAKTERYRSN